MRILVRLWPMVVAGALVLSMACGGGGGSSNGNSPPPAAPTIASFAANPTTIMAGGSAELTGTFNNGTGVVTPGNLACSSGIALGITPTVTTTYTLTVSGSAGAPATQAATVTVVPASASPSITSFIANPSTIMTGGVVQLTGTFSNGTGIITPGNIPATSGAAVTVTPAVTTTYTLMVTNVESISATAQANVIVVPIASALIYTDPSDPTAWRLVRDSVSTSTHLVLDLLAPTGMFGQGLTLILTTDTVETSWSYVSGTSFMAQNAYPNAMVSIAKVMGPDLRIVIGQAAGTPVTYGSSPILTVALDLIPGAKPESVVLSVSQGGHLGSAPNPVPINIEIGSLQAQ
jgi:hypothetical protein